MNKESLSQFVEFMSENLSVETICMIEHDRNPKIKCTTSTSERYACLNCAVNYFKRSLTIISKEIRKL